MFIYLKQHDVVFAIDKIIKIYIDNNLTTIKVIIEGGHGFDLFHDTEELAKAALLDLVARLDINEPMENGYDW